MPQQDNNPPCTSGVKNPPPPGPGRVNVQVGKCSDALNGFPASAGEATSFPMLRPGADSSVTVRILADRSVADVFVEAGRWSGTVAWQTAAPRRAGDSTVSLFAAAGSTGVSADIDVWSMGCGWVDPSYTEHPTM